MKNINYQSHTYMQYISFFLFVYVNIICGEIGESKIIVIAVLEYMDKN